MWSQRPMTIPTSCSIISTVVRERLVHPADEIAHLLLLVVIHAGHRLIEQQQLRLGDEGTREVDAFLDAIGQGARFHIPITALMWRRSRARLGAVPVSRASFLASAERQAEGVAERCRCGRRG